jgi:hypothetical protein
MNGKAVMIVMVIFVEGSARFSHVRDIRAVGHIILFVQL